MDGLSSALCELGFKSSDEEEALRLIAIGMVIQAGVGAARLMRGIKHQVEAGRGVIMSFEGKPLVGFGRGLNYHQCDTIAVFFGKNLSLLVPQED